jgi:hypothetical protein
LVFNVTVDTRGSYCIVNIPQLVVAKATECIEVVLIGSERIRKMELLTQKIEETDKRIKTLEEHFLDIKISLVEFRSMKDSLDKDKRKIASELNALLEQKDQMDKKIKDAIQLGKGLKSFYNNLDVNGKAKLLGSIFPEKLQIENGQCRTTIINPALLLVLRNTKCFEKKKAGHLSEFLQMSRRVETGDFHRILLT